MLTQGQSDWARIWDGEWVCLQHATSFPVPSARGTWCASGTGNEVLQRGCAWLCHMQWVLAIKKRSKPLLPSRHRMHHDANSLFHQRLHRNPKQRQSLVPGITQSLFKEYVFVNYLACFYEKSWLCCECLKCMVWFLAIYSRAYPGDFSYFHHGILFKEEEKKFKLHLTFHAVKGEGMNILCF